MERLVDDPSNDMMLEHNIHDNFDKLKVYLEQTVTEESARRAKIDRNGYRLLSHRFDAVTMIYNKIFRVVYILQKKKYALSPKKSGWKFERTKVYDEI